MLLLFTHFAIRTYVIDANTPAALTGKDRSRAADPSTRSGDEDAHQRDVSAFVEARARGSER